MYTFEEKIARIFGFVGWVVAGIGGLSTALLCIRIFSGGMMDPRRKLILAAGSFGCLAAGIFLVVITIIINLLIQIARNTDGTDQDRGEKRKVSS